MLLSTGPWLACFRYTIELTADDVTPVEAEFGNLDKGSFVTPEMSALSFGDQPKILADVCRHLAADQVWRGLYGRPKKTLQMDISKDTALFWEEVVAEAASVGPAPILIVQYSPLGEEVFAALHRLPSARLAQRDVVHEKGVPSGGGVGYHGTVEGIRVYAGPGILSGKALLCSSEIIRSIKYGSVHGSDVADFSFVDGDDPANSRVNVKFAQKVEWLDTPLVEFDFSMPPSQVEDGAAKVDQ